MRLIDADELINQGYEIVVDGWQYDTCNKSIDIDNIPTAYSVDKIVAELEKELSLADKEKERCTGQNDLQFDSAKGYASGISTAIEIVKQVSVGKEREAEEYNGGWISVKDRRPDKAGSYLVIGKSGGATVTRWYMPSEFYPEGHFGGNGADYIRYWMPRPEPPKERD